MATVNWRHPAILPERAFNTWDSAAPASLIHLPLGLRLAPMAYADSLQRASSLPPAEIRPGPRSLDGAVIHLSFSLGDTRVALHYARPDPYSVVIHWRTLAHGEWGLRFWLLWCLEGPPGSEVVYDPRHRDLALTVDGRHALLGGEPPLLASFHPDREALAEELHQRGYAYLGSRGSAGPLGALRYNLEETPEGRLALALADHPDRAREQYRAALADPLPQLPESDPDSAAIRDVMGWNTVHDPINQRPYTALSRHWNTRKFGGYGLWLDDILYHALLAGALDGELARDNLMAVLAGATPAGNLPCLLTGFDAWVDRSQPPIGGLILWLLYLRHGERSWLELAYPVLLRNHRWWWRERCLGEGLMAYGTSALGQGLYQGTRLAARNESSMDNSPVHEEGRLTEAGLLDIWDVGLNSLLAVDAAMLARIAGVLGRREEQLELESLDAELRGNIRRKLWDEQRGVFANRRPVGGFVQALAPTSFYPLLAGAASREQGEALVVNWLHRADRFGDPWWLPACERAHPAHRDNSYWRGRVWPPLHFLVYQGLRRYGYQRDAQELARQASELFQRAWRDRHCPENYNADTGEALDQPDTDRFYGWGALMPYLAVAERLDFNPWEGWNLSFDEDTTPVGPLRCPLGEARTEIQRGALTLRVDGAVLFGTNLRGRLRHLHFSPALIALDLPPGCGPGWLTLPGVEPERVLAAQLEGEVVEVQADGQGIRVEVGLLARGGRLRLVLMEPV